MTQLGSICHEGTHIVFKYWGLSESGKTQIFEVHSNDVESYLGDIKWFGRWRKYAFYPVTNTIFEQTCLREIAEFCETQTKQHRLQKKEQLT